MSEREVLLGAIIEGAAPPVGRLARKGPAPAAALASILREELDRSRCLVLFSGGRDSSALLAAALEVSRREGLGEPIPLTLRYPGVTEADETEWQELVINHLAPADWERVDIHPPLADLLGPVGAGSLIERGLIWPPALHLETGWLDRAAGTTVLTGEGGDEVFGPHRATSLRIAARRARHHPRRLRPAMAAELLKQAAPAAFRRTAIEQQLRRDGYLTWLRQPRRDKELRAMAKMTSADPWFWPTAIRRHRFSRRVVLGEANRGWLAGSFGARFAHPFLDVAFTDAIARTAGPLGYAGRTDAMHKVFGRLLPDAVLGRETKASFNTVYRGPATIAFARSWNGEGVDPEIVDVEKLRSSWLAESMPSWTMALLQAAWLATAPMP